MNYLKICLITIGLLIATVSCYSQNITEWRGQNRTGNYLQDELLNEWPAEGPELLWSTEKLPEGYASLCIVDDIIYSTGYQDTVDVCFALDFEGNILWETVYGRAWNGADPVTRSTPTFDNGKLYVSSGYGDIACLDANSGDLVWQIKGYEKWDINFCTWGIAESLIVSGDKVLFSPVGSKTMTVALNKENGEVIWETESLNDSAAYTPPILVEYAEKQMMINVASNHIYGVDISNGEIMWKFLYYDINTPLWHPRAPIINCNSPLFHNNQVYVTSGYNHTGVMLKLNEEGTNAELMWADTVLDTHHGGVVKVGDYIYGSNWINNGTGNWVCIDWKTGKKKWEQKWKGKGSLISVNDKIVIVPEKTGYVGLIDATPEKFNLTGSLRVTLGRGPYWNHPVIYKDDLYVRHSDALMVYRIK